MNFFAKIPDCRVPAVLGIIAFFAISGYFVFRSVQDFASLPESLSADWRGISSDRSAFDMIRSPSSKDLAVYQAVMEYYMRDHFWLVVGFLSSVYIFLQAFAIPGPAIIAVLMAALFGPWEGGIMSMSCSLIGSSICYFLFYLLGRPVLTRFFSKGLSSFKAKLDANRDNIFYYFLFLRVTPILPNWFINISSGNLGIRYSVFFFGTLIGLIPNAIVLARAGVELKTLGETNGTSGFDAKRLAGLLAIGLVALLPILIKNRFKNKVK